jgi:putative ABC transport system permease protein
MTTPNEPRRGDSPAAAAGRGRAGTLRAAARIARADLAGRPVQTGLTALAIFAAATALVVTLALRGGLDRPFETAQRATNGAHVTAFGEGDLSDLATLPGVAQAVARPRAGVTTRLNGQGVDLGVEALP